MLVSWLRDEKFWRGEIRRATVSLPTKCSRLAFSSYSSTGSCKQGQDISKLSSTGHFTFIDGLTALAASKPDVALAGIQQAIAATMQQHDGKTMTLILDQPDTLLATAATTSQALSHFMLDLRSKSQSTILTLSADLPLVSASSSTQGTPTPLERETAAFLVQQAHAATFVIGVRELETGAARDVSGVLRVTRGGDAGDGDGDKDSEEVKGMEALFLVGRDGGVKVFERGSAG